MVIGVILRYSEIGLERHHMSTKGVDKNIHQTSKPPNQDFQGTQSTIIFGVLNVLKASRKLA